METVIVFGSINASQDLASICNWRDSLYKGVSKAKRLSGNVGFKARLYEFDLSIDPENKLVYVDNEEITSKNNVIIYVAKVFVHKWNNVDRELCDKNVGTATYDQFESFFKTFFENLNCNDI